MGAGFALIALFNVVCILHARAMTTFVDDGERTPNPEELGVLDKARTLVFGVRVPRPRNEVTPASVGLAFETYTVDGPDGALLEVWHVPAEESSGLVILCHGYAASKDQLLGTAEALHDAHYSVLLLDFAGSGGSSGHIPRF